MLDALQLRREARSDFTTRYATYTEITLKDDISVSISPATANVPTEGTLQFTASISASGAPSKGITWSVNGIAGGNATVGTILASGTESAATYTAPASAPNPANVTVAATSVADGAKSASASVAISCAASNAISPTAATVALGQSQVFMASLCAQAGATITWDVNGAAGGNSTLGTITPNGPNSAIYSAPAAIPSPSTVTIHATAGNSASASATVTISSNVSVSITPSSASIALGQRRTFTANVNNTSDTAVSWAVSGIPGGNPTVGQICQSGSNPCVAVSGDVSVSVDYLAPQTVPSSNPVTLEATSTADPATAGIRDQAPPR